MIDCKIIGLTRNYEGELDPMTGIVYYRLQADSDRIVVSTVQNLSSNQYTISIEKMPEEPNVFELGNM